MEVADDQYGWGPIVDNSVCCCVVGSPVVEMSVQL